MLLTIDIGNTNIVFGVYRGDELVVHWRALTERSTPVEGYKLMLQQDMDCRGLSAGAFDGVIIASVVPQVLAALKPACRRYFGREPLVVGPDMNLGITLRYENLSGLGADRIVNAAAAFSKHRRSLIVIDFGTATTFDYVSPEGAYRGGAIAPGITTAGEALFSRAAQLPRIDFVYPRRIIGCNTVESMQTGIVAGYVALVDGLVAGMSREAGTDPFVVATGGLARIVAAHTRSINEIDEFLTLEGLKILFEKNA